MPTELPLRRPSLPKATRTGNLFFVAAVLAMLVISAVVLLHPDALAGGFP